MKLLVVALSVLLTNAVVTGGSKVSVDRSEPKLTIPFWDHAPKIDGELEPGEWDYAAAITMFEAYPGYGVPLAMRAEQPVVYVYWNQKYLYLALYSVESNTNTVVSACVQHDNTRIIGDDCMELMVAPGSGEAIERYDFPVFYWALNAIGTVWDAKFIPKLAETHNSWESGVETASVVDGTLWTMEVRIPLAAIRKKPPQPGETWRMNFDRTYSGYKWSAWSASGGLNRADVGGDVTFSLTAPAVQLLSVVPLIEAKLGAVFKVANNTGTPQTVVLRVSGRGADEANTPMTDFKALEKTVTVPPNQHVEAALVGKTRLKPVNMVKVEAVGKDGKPLLLIERQVMVPSPRIVKTQAKKVPLVYVFPRFLPSLERLAVLIDYTAWARKIGYVGPAPKAEVKVWRKGEEQGTPVLQGELTKFEKTRGVWRHSTKDLPEGEYVVKVRVLTTSGDALVEHDDWFEKRIFDWMRTPRGVSDKVPELYSPLIISDRSTKTWGREYQFNESGLPKRIVSQKKELLDEEISLLVERGGKSIPTKVKKPFAFSEKKETEAKGEATMEADGLSMRMKTRMEYDGLVVHRLTYGPTGEKTSVDRMRVRIPLTGKYCRFYSASGDRLGTSVLGDVLPDTPGKVFDSARDTYAVTLSPTFATLFWTGDYGTCFCYAADSCEGWALRDDAPAVEAFREGDKLVLWLNLVDRPLKLTGPRTLEFAFQAGPVKALPKGWRGVQYGGNPANAPVTFNQIGGSGFTSYGAPYFLHPGLDEKEREKSRKHVLDKSADGKYLIQGYHRWPAAIKGMPGTRVFRSEWGIDKHAWNAARKPTSDWMWRNRFFGENKDRYIMFLVQPVPSYVEYCANGFDLSLKKTALAGHYDDTGYPIAVFDEELGLGYVRKDGRKIYSSGLWIYRERWKREATVCSQNNRPNYLCDSQHVQAHYMPAYGFIGVWAPCERGFYNPFKTGDNFDFYKSIERYYAINPSHAFGQIPAIGMSTPQIRYGLQVRDTRGMMALAFVHDQDVGSFGHRDPWTVARLRAARNVFRPWEDDVTFAGFWENGEAVRTNDENFRVSCWKRPGSVLFVIVNIGAAATTGTITPDWAKLGVKPANLKLADPETGKKLPLTDGAFNVGLKRHDLRLVLAGNLDGYDYKPQALGADLPRPRTVVEALSDPLTGPKLGPAWTEVKMDDEGSDIGFVADKLFVQCGHYGHTFMTREFGEDDVSVQCMIMRKGTGCSDDWAGELGLWWENGSFVRATPAWQPGKFRYMVSGKPPKLGGPINKESPLRWYPFFPNWVRIRLTPTEIEFYGSADGKTWTRDHVVSRGKRFAGPPVRLVLGNGNTGKGPLLKNTLAQHFHPGRGNLVTLFSDLVVGRD